MDSITKLLRSEDLTINIKYHNILMIVNKFIKYAHLISYNEESTVKQTI